MWVPANDIEQHMREALRAGNQEEYFRLLARTDLLLPFAEETTPSNNGSGSWATWATEERTHVLVFTSPEAMRACLHSHAGAFRTVSFTALSDAWPDSEWWLAVDPGTPIEGYLPAWFVRQLAAGDTQLPDEQPGGQANAQPQAPMYAANDYPPRQDPPPQFGQFESSPFGATPDAGGHRYGEASSVAPDLSPSGLPRRERAPGPAAPADTGLPQRETFGATGSGEGFGSGLPQRDGFGSATPGDGYQPPPAAGTGLPQRDGYPAATPGGYDAAPAADSGLPQRDGFGAASGEGFGSAGTADNFGTGLPQRDGFGAAAGGYDSGLPKREDYAAPAAPDAGLPQREEFGTPDSGLPQRDGYAPPADDFGSGLPQREEYSSPGPEAFNPAAAHRDAAPDSYDSPMASAMPHRDSGGYPAEPAASIWDPAPQPAAPSWESEPASSPSNLPVPVSTALPDWPDEDTVEDELALAASTGDTKSYLSVLLRAWAYLPVAEDCPPSSRPGDPEFRWHTDLIDGAYTITAFTSYNRMMGRYGDRHYITTTFGRLTAQWPGLEYSLYVNPSTEVGANVPGPQVTTLVTWARTQGLLQPALDMDALSAPKRPEPQQQQQAVAPAAPAAIAAEPAAVGQPETMQKVLPHQQVAMTLERGYDRVAGFVHRYGEVSDLNTPERLYNALGLLRDGVDFSPADDAVHVIRWTGHRPDLYRIAYGGNDHAAAGRNNGWIVEPPPFSGDGYAPSVEGRRIVEYKVDSVRLPHGAVMTRIGADGRSDDIAVYDSDRREWIRADIEAAASSWDISPGGYRQEQQHA